MYVYYRKTNESDFTKSMTETGLNWVHGTVYTFTVNRPIM